MMPKVTVIMPSLNVVDYIEECIKSAISQTMSAIEILCIDAGSSDGTLEILQKYADMDSRVQIINSDRRSYGYQVNLGIKLAKGEYIAILETDDYITKTMYESLYRKALQYDLDYIKSDYVKVEQLDDEIQYSPISIFHGDETKLYETIISTQVIPEIYWKDIHIWKGLYRKNFLLENGIFLNETDGAAYQDYGFGLLLHTKAMRGMFVPEHFYYYRWGRVGASSGNKSILKYSYQEFRRVLEDNLIQPTEEQLKQIYYRIAIDFPSEYSRVLRMVDYDTHSEYLAPYYDWFKILLQKAFRLGKLERTQGSAKFWKALDMLIEFPEEYAECTKTGDENKRYNIELLRRSGVAVFGAGSFGVQAYKLLRSYNISVNAIVDNSSDKQGKVMGEHSVISLQQCAKENKSIIYVIANLHHKEEIKKQLLEYGICQEKIISYEECRDTIGEGKWRITTD